MSVLKRIDHPDARQFLAGCEEKGGTGESGEEKHGDG
jgi:hypothetical protein